MDTNDRKSTLDKYLRKPYPALVTPGERLPEPDDQDDAGESGYRALVEQREKKGNAPRFRIITRKGQSYGCGYAYLLGWLYSPPDTLSIYTTTHVFVVTGKNLQRIEDAFMRDRVKQLREFNDGQDQRPADGEPIITRLEVTSRLDPV